MILKQIFQKIPSYMLVTGAVVATATAYIFYPTSDDKRRALKNNHHHKQKSYPRGLINHNNECFMNVILQSLSASQNVTNWLNKHANLSHASLFSTLIDLVKKINRHEDTWDDESNEFYAASSLRNALNAHNWHIKLEENDCHELFHLLMDCMDVEQAEQTKSSKSLNYFMNYPNFTNSIHSCNPFHGYLASQLQCLNCGYKYPMRLESFYSLSLTLPQRTRGDQRTQFTLNDCLRNFFRIEFISDMICEKCKNSMGKGCMKKSAIAKLPESLCIQIQRNAWSDYSHQMIKQTDFVQYPLRIKIDGHKKTQKDNDKPINNYEYDDYNSFSLKQLGLGGLIGGNNSPKSDQIKVGQSNVPCNDFYELRSAIVHYGSAQSGHFITYRRTLDSTSTRESWIQVSDNDLRPCKKSQLLNNNAYMLFYDRVSL